jgi:hypothetical protein
VLCLDLAWSIPHSRSIIIIIWHEMDTDNLVQVHERAPNHGSSKDCFRGYGIGHLLEASTNYTNKCMLIVNMFIITILCSNMFRPLLGSSSGIHLKVKITNRMTILCYQMCKKQLLHSTCGSLFYILLQEFDVFVLPVGTTGSFNM